MNYTAAKVSKKTAAKRRNELEKLRKLVRQGALALNPDEELRVSGTPYLLPVELNEDGACIKGAVVSRYARELFTISQILFRLYNYREAGKELPLSLYDYAETYINEHGDSPDVLLAVINEVERRVQIPQEDQAFA